MTARLGNLTAQINDVFWRVLGRPPTQDEVKYWTQQIDLGLADIVVLEVALREYQGESAPVNTDEKPVEHEPEAQHNGFDMLQGIASAAAGGIGGSVSTGAATGGISTAAVAAAGGVAAAAGGGGGGGASAAASGPVPAQEQTVSKLPVSALSSKQEIKATPAVGSGGSGSKSAPATAESDNSPTSSQPAPQPQPAPQADNTFQLMDSQRNWLGGIYSIDLNKDGIDEIFVAGRLTQPATAASWQNSNVVILGWNNDDFTIENSHWFADVSDASILGTEPSVRFGDFNGDGWTDVFVAPSTDMNLYGPGVVYWNDAGQGLTRQDIDIGSIWAHDSAVADLNSDGFDDIVISGYGPDQTLLFGRADGSFDVMTGLATANYSGIAAGDFMGDGSITFVMTDSQYTGASDTALMAWNITQDGQGNDVAYFSKIAGLPPDRFTLDHWSDHHAYMLQPDRMPHTIRALTMDFNRDGLDDVVIMTSANDANNRWHVYSELQFLENEGDGLFLDVTDELLLEYNKNTVVSYTPQLIDINEDGLMDIWLSAIDYHGAENSTRAIMANADGTFSEDFAQEIQALRDALGGQPAPSQMVRDPNGDWYVMTMEFSPDPTNVQFALAPTVDWIA